MITKTVKVGIGNDIEARTLAMIVQIAGKYDSSVRVECGGRSMNAKSIMGMLSLEMGNGDEVNVAADGPDEEAAVSELVQFLNKN